MLVISGSPHDIVNIILKNNIDIKNNLNKLFIISIIRLLKNYSIYLLIISSLLHNILKLFQ